MRGLLPYSLQLPCALVAIARRSLSLVSLRYPLGAWVCNLCKMSIPYPAGNTRMDWQVFP